MDASCTNAVNRFDNNAVASTPMQIGVARS
jgi:hypothetical protein